MTLPEDAVFRGPAPHPVLGTDPSSILLGLAQDGGRPQLGCERACCTNVAEPGLPVALGLLDGDRRFLIDATPALPAQLPMLGGLDGVLLTHAHIGHYTGLMYLGREALNVQRVPVWAMPRMRAFLEGNGPWAQLGSIGNVEFRDLEDGVEVELSPRLHVTPRLVSHRDEYSETVGFFVRSPTWRLFYLPDIDRWDGFPLAETLAQVDIALLDGTFYDDAEVAGLGRDPRAIPHPRVVDTLQRLAALPAEQQAKVRFIHLNHSNRLWGDASE
ncbi:MAG: MBL fold metallo-hydrolase [Deltaproteobacteria bacterium]|nr:MBL fold metallo-hydrolase [Deltaproteobacteria bacterium]